MGSTTHLNWWLPDFWTINSMSPYQLVSLAGFLNQKKPSTVAPSIIFFLGLSCSLEKRPEASVVLPAKTMARCSVNKQKLKCQGIWKNVSTIIANYVKEMLFLVSTNLRSRFGPWNKSLKLYVSYQIGVVPKIGVAQNGKFIQIHLNPMKVDDLGVPLFLETPKCNT